METVKNLSGKKIKAKRHKRVNRSLGGDITVFVTITLLGMFIAPSSCLRNRKCL